MCSIFNVQTGNMRQLFKYSLLFLMFLGYAAAQADKQNITKKEVMSQTPNHVNVDQIGDFESEIEELEEKFDSLESSLVPTDLIGWTVFQRRKDGSVDFYKDWKAYLAGFGDPAKEFWLGLREISRLMKLGKYELRIDLQDFDGHWKYAYYK
uniref:angiopoietin-related protein 4-like n=1 Tax=Styela clava TaxID=7725 RepID=UPI00193A8D67|nr:angiopoietin-related protein 4-like [Styela clava]